MTFNITGSHFEAPCSSCLNAIVESEQNTKEKHFSFELNFLCWIIDCWKLHQNFEKSEFAESQLRGVPMPNKFFRSGFNNDTFYIHQKPRKKTLFENAHISG